jgi:fatty acid/phospholipid biosynthesis enzyme
MGDISTRSLLNIDNPKVGISNIGEEALIIFQ